MHVFLFGCLQFWRHEMANLWYGPDQAKINIQLKNHCDFSLSRTHTQPRHIAVWFVWLLACLFSALICSFHFILIFRVTPLHHQTFCPPFRLRVEIFMFSAIFGLKYQFILSKYFEKSGSFCSIKCCILNSEAVANVVWPWQTKSYRHQYEIHSKTSNLSVMLTFLQMRRFSNILLARTRWTKAKHFPNSYFQYKHSSII